MYATVRHYQNTTLADELAARRNDVEAVISPVQGLRGYYLMRTDDGCMTITVCDDRAGVEESSRRAAEYLRDHAGDFSGDTTPMISSGEVLIQIGATAAV